MLPKAGEVVIDGTQTVREATQYRLEASQPGSPAKFPDMEGWLHFARAAEKSSIDSVLVAINRYEPDPMLTVTAMGRETQKLKYILAFRAGLTQPAAFVQQVNSLSALIGGRIALNIVAGSSTSEQRSYGDFLSHDDRYHRAEEFLTICNDFWRQSGPVNFSGKHYQIENGVLFTPFTSPTRSAPEIFVSGHSPPSINLAVTQGSCYLRVIDTPEKLAPILAPIQAQGMDICLRLGIICRPTREEALSVIDEILAYAHETAGKQKLPDMDDSQMYREAAIAAPEAWINEHIWAGFKPFYGPVWTTLVGTPDEVAEALIEYKKIGVNQFILSGWPELAEMEIFGGQVIPKIRKLERELAGE